MRTITRDTKGKIETISGCKTIPSHLRTLRIPPAWTDVTVNTSPTAKLWVTGYDVKGRKQSIYSTQHRTTASADKFERVRGLCLQADRVRTQIEIDLKRKNAEWYEESVVAYLIYETGIRPGSNTETGGDVRAFGGTTLQARHVKIMSSGRVWLDFTGKKGVRIKLRVTNPWLVEELVRRKEAAGTAYSTPLFSTSDSSLRRYVKTLGDGTFSPKDFRTMRGTSVAIEFLKGKRMPATKTKRNELMRAVIREVADTLGNTPAVAKSSYIDPSVLAVFMIA